MALLIGSCLLVGCGEAAPLAAQKARPAAVPSSRADGQAWPQVPRTLRRAVGKPIRLAAAADVATVRAAGCEPPVPEAELLTANIDDHALTATYRYVPRDSGNPDLNGRAIVAGCTARWNRAEAGWEKTSCGHYAPAWTRRAHRPSSAAVADTRSPTASWAGARCVSSTGIGTRCRSPTATPAPFRTSPSTPRAASAASPRSELSPVDLPSAAEGALQQVAGDRRHDSQQEDKPE
jgi:hypothetical protein